MTKQVDVGLFFGESFYEVILTERPSDAILFSETFFNLKDPFKTRFPKIIQSLDAVKLEAVYISYRYLERIFKFKLGGSVAQVVTKGFEQWLTLNQQNRFENLFSLKAPPDLSSVEMIFPLSEKINFRGEIEIELSESTLTELVADLKKKEAKRICLNLVNSEKNPKHRDLVKQTLESNQFEVFDALELGKESDVPAWRSSLIEASLAGTFNEMKSELHEVLVPFIDPMLIYIVPNQHSSKKELRNILSGLFSIEDSFFEFGKKEFNLPDQFDVLHLGVENFSIWRNEDVPWQSPWGLTSIVNKKRIDLKVQPTNSFNLNIFEEVEISQEEESFEPGPMSLGRGKIPCVYDVLNSDSTSPDLLKKIKDSFWALARSSNNRLSAEKTFDTFSQVIWDRILVEANMLVTQETLVIYGNLPASFENRAKNVFKSKNLVFISQKSFPKSRLALLRGRAWAQ